MASEALGEQKSLFKSKTETINVSNATFSMAKLMTAVLMGCFVLTASKQFFGDPIRCHKDSPVPSVQVFESHCFMEETYTIASNNCNNKDFYDYYNCNSFKAHKAHLYEDTVFHSYYRWVPHVLLLQEHKLMDERGLAEAGTLLRQCQGREASQAGARLSGLPRNLD